MENVIVNGNSVSLETLRKNVVVALEQGRGAERNYALALNAMFGDFDWFNVEARDVAESAKPVHAEKKALFKELNAVKHSNPSTVWARIRKYGREEKYPVAEGSSEGGEGSEGDGEGGAGKRDREPMTRNIDELVSLYKFNARQESLPEKIKQAQTHICAALRALGVDLSLIK
jgi:hypothetical protein